MKFVNHPPSPWNLSPLPHLLGPNSKEIWRKCEGIWRKYEENMTLNLPKLSASWGDKSGKLRPVIVLRGIWKNSELYNWGKYENCEPPPPPENLSPSDPPFGPIFWKNIQKNEGDMKEIWRKYEGHILFFFFSLRKYDPESTKAKCDLTR